MKLDATELELVRLCQCIEELCPGEPEDDTEHAAQDLAVAVQQYLHAKGYTKSQLCEEQPRNIADITHDIFQQMPAMREVMQETVKLAVITERERCIRLAREELLESTGAARPPGDWPKALAGRIADRLATNVSSPEEGHASRGLKPAQKLLGYVRAWVRSCRDYTDVGREDETFARLYAEDLVAAGLERAAETRTLLGELEVDVMDGEHALALTKIRAALGRPEAARHKKGHPDCDDCDEYGPCDRHMHTTTGPL